MQGEDAEQLRTWLEPILNAVDAGHITPEQAVNDLSSLKEMIHSQRPEDQSHLEKIYLRYSNARKPSKAKNMTLPIVCEICLWIAGISCRA